MLYQILGFFNIALLVILTSPYWVRKLAGWLYPKKRIAGTKFYKTLRAVHKPAGIALVIVTLIHGYLALGSLRLHTGVVAGVMVLVTATLGALFYYTKKRLLFRWHKAAALAVVLLTALHLIAPNLLYTLFG